jgi:DNA polymerase III delta prime subunit
LGFDAVEVNASDTRNKADSKTKEGVAGKTSNRIKEMVTNAAIATNFTAGREQLLVMDEVDGMSGESLMKCMALHSCCFFDLHIVFGMVSENTAQ